MTSRLRSLFHFQESGLILVIIGLGIILAIFGGTVPKRVVQTLPNGDIEPVMTKNAQGEEVPMVIMRNKFFNPQNLAQLAKDSSFIGIMAVGMAMVIISGGIDLSVGCVFALAAVLAANVLHYYGPTGAGSASPGLGLVLGIATCLGVAALCGLINGALVVALRVHPFIITLGTMTIFRGIAFVVTGGQSVTDFPPMLQNVIKHETGEELYLVPSLVMLVVMGLGWIYLQRLAAGRRVFAVGGNELAARFSGIRVERVKLAVYVISAVCAGLAALMSLGYYGSGSSGDADGYELDVVAAAVIGGASLTGGRGSALGAMLGAVVLKMISSGIILLGIDQSYSKVIIGGAVITAVVMDKLNTWLTQRRLSRAAG